MPYCVAYGCSPGYATLMSDLLSVPSSSSRQRQPTRPSVQVGEQVEDSVHVHGCTVSQPPHSRAAIRRALADVAARIRLSRTVKGRSRVACEGDRAEDETLRRRGWRRRRNDPTADGCAVGRQYRATERCGSIEPLGGAAAQSPSLPSIPATQRLCLGGRSLRGHKTQSAAATPTRFNRQPANIQSRTQSIQTTHQW